MQLLGRHDVVGNRFDQRRGERRDFADPGRHRGAVELHAFARVNAGWSQYLLTRMCANRPAPAWPRSIGSDGMGLCAMLSQRRQENAEVSIGVGLGPPIGIQKGPL